MSRKLLLSIVMVAVGASLLVAAGFASPAQSSSPAAASQVAKTGGTLNIDINTDFDYTDPALDYYQLGWELMYAVCLKLLNYPDANGAASSQLQPEAAAGFPKISNSGKTYDFNVNASFTKFSNGQPVTAKNFLAAINRNANPKMQSPAGGFMTDIVGAQAALDGKASSVSGATVKGSHLIIRLTRPAPDFLSRIAMPFFCAIPTNTPINENGIETFPSAGPYYIASRTANKQAVIKRNPNYKGKRPHNFDQIVYTVGNSQEATRLRVEQAQTDFADGGVPPASYAEIAQKYGVNKGQFWVKPILSVSYLAFNHDRALFKGSNALGNVNLKKAINYAIDRRALLAQSGYLAGKRTDQILPPGMNGFRDADLYPLKGPNFAKAKSLATGHTGDGKAVLYTCTTAVCQQRAQIYQFDLKQMGLDVEVRQFARSVQFGKEGNKGEPYDLADEGWLADYADPFDFINILLAGDQIHENNNVTFAYFNDPGYNKKMAQAALLSGSARYKAYGNLDIDISKNAAPWAARSNGTNRLFVSKRVGCFTYNNIYGPDYAAWCLK